MMKLIAMFTVLSTTFSFAQKTEELKTFSSEYGFTLKYPASWGLTSLYEDETEPEKNDAVIISGPTLISKTELRGEVIVACHRRGPFYPYVPLLTRMSKEMIYPKRIKLSERDLKIGGVPAKEIIHYSGDSKDSLDLRGRVELFIAFNHKKHNCEIRYIEIGKPALVMKTDKEWKYRSVMDAVVSSFRFTDK